jgi:hypothetical protein
VASKYTQELLDRAQAYVEKPLTARRYEEGLAELTTLYSDITGQAVGTCRQCQVSDFMAVVTAYIREATRFLHPETVKDSKYTFTPAFINEKIADGRYSKVVTAENLEDADAEVLLKLGYEHVIMLKSNEEASAEGDSEQGDAGSQQPAPTEREVALEQQLAQANQTIANNAQTYEALNTRYTEATEARSKAEKALAAEKKAHALTSKERDNLKTQVQTLTTPPVPEATLTASTGGATSTPAPAAPAVPTTPADGTQA